MEGSLLLSQNPEAWFRRFVDYVEKAKAVRGVFVLNLHQESFSRRLYPYVVDGYEMILEALKEDREVYVDTVSNVLSLLESHQCAAA